MLLLSSGSISLLQSFAPLFDSRVWGYAQLLLVGAILAPGKRTVTSVLRIVGLGNENRFQNYHRVLNRARWNSRMASRSLLGLLVRSFAPSGPILVGLDDTIERRWGKQIQARGIYRDPVRSSHSHFVKTSGLRWLSLMLLVDIPWAGRVWALPFLTVLAPSERYHQKRQRRHKTLPRWGRQMLLPLRR
jgi:DDE superfamily endonuclease